MKAILIDAYRAGDYVALWLKTEKGNIRLELPFIARIYLEKSDLAKSILVRHNLPMDIAKKRNYLGELISVYCLPIRRLSRFERIVKRLEAESGHRMIMHNADIAPEQMLLFERGIKPFSMVETDGNDVFPIREDAAPLLEKIDLEIISSSDIRADQDSRIKKIIYDGKPIAGEEREILERFTRMFGISDPDVIMMESAFVKMPYLARRLESNNIRCPLNRWDEKPIKSKGGKTFFSYGKVMYRDYAVRLNGRFLVDSNTTVGGECNIDGIIELSQLSGTRFQQVASRSFGAVFQSALVGNLLLKNYLVPFKEKPVDPPISLHSLLKFDRVGYTFDSLTGLHKDVAEIDFSSLFPWIIYNYNISPETILKGGPPYQDIPNLPLKISLKKKGVVPTAIKPMIDRRMHYKKNPSALNKARSIGLKYVLVTSYGYLRFREFKLGIATSHMAIGAFAREILIKTKEICESCGFKIVHGIVDSLYIQKQGITEKEVKNLCKEIELEIGIPIAFEGIFKWIVFLPSVNDINRPVPARYYGVFSNGEIKARGLEVRQGGTPHVVKKFQQEILEMISACGNKEEIIGLFTYLCQHMRKTIFLLPARDPRELACSVRIGKTDYANEIAQKAAVNLLKSKGIKVFPGQKISYIFSKKGVVLPEDYNGRLDEERYKRLLVRSLFVLLQPFGFSKEEVFRMAGYERQKSLLEYIDDTRLYTDMQTTKEICIG